MSKKFLFAALAIAAAAVVGCEAKPQSVRKVDASVLPAAAKGQLAQDATVDGVEELTYSKGAKQLLIRYHTPDGKPRRLLWSESTETTPTGVFEHVMH